MSFSRWNLVLAVSLPVYGCGTTQSLRYVGSSTIGTFVDDARQSYRDASIAIWVEPESYGGEQAVLHGIADIGGVARPVDPALIEAGLVATRIGHDVIAVIVNPAQSVDSLTTPQLRGIFTGQITDWTQVGGTGGRIKPFVVGAESATLAVFRSAVLGRESFTGSETVRPDADVVTRVASEPEAIGFISVAFTHSHSDVKAISVDGRSPSDAERYPIGRPLYLVTRGEPAGAAARFIAWSRSEDGRRLMGRHFACPKVPTPSGAESTR